jgi:hypothetical protein
MSQDEKSLREMPFGVSENLEQYPEIRSVRVIGGTLPFLADTCDEISLLACLHLYPEGALMSVADCIYIHTFPISISNRCKDAPLI